MSIGSAVTSLDAAVAGTPSKGNSTLASRLLDISRFFRGVRQQMRFGELTRASLRLLRFQISAEVAECEWIAREPDVWDAGLPNSAGDRHASLQALRDAIDVRNLLFSTMPQADLALFRVYRAGAEREELIITGVSERSDRHAPGIRSLPMRAQLLGFRFFMEDGVLHELPTDAHLRVGA